MINYNIMNIILDKNAFQKWIEKMIKINENYHKTYKYCPGGLVRCINNDLIFRYNYRRLLDIHYNKYIYNPYGNYIEFKFKNLPKNY